MPLYFNHFINSVNKTKFLHGAKKLNKCKFSLPLYYYPGNWTIERQNLCHGDDEVRQQSLDPGLELTLTKGWGVENSKAESNLWDEFKFPFQKVTFLALERKGQTKWWLHIHRKSATSVSSPVISTRAKATNKQASRCPSGRDRQGPGEKLFLSLTYVCFRGYKCKHQ